MIYFICISYNFIFWHRLFIYICGTKPRQGETVITVGHTTSQNCSGQLVGWGNHGIAGMSGMDYECSDLYVSPSPYTTAPRPDAQRF